MIQNYTPVVDPRGQLNPGQVFCVNSRNGSDSGNHGKNWASAMATIDAAINLTTANTNDVVLVAPEHTETVSAESAIDLDTAGTQIIGLRHGRTMPTITFDTAEAADIKLAAAGVGIRNLRFLGGIDVMTGAIEVSAADCSIIDCEYRDVVGQATDVIITTNAAERLLIDGYRHIGALGAGANSAIALVGAIDGVVIRNCYLVGDFAVAAIDLRTAALTNLWVRDCVIWNDHATGTAIEDTITASTGIIGPNIAVVLETDGANITEAVTGATFHLIEPVRVVNSVAEKSMDINWTASTDDA